MKAYEVTVHTRVRETYWVEAETEAEALHTWNDTEPDQQECVEITSTKAEELSGR